MEDEAKLTIRFPLELKAWLAATAVMNRRSQNAEIVHRLEAARAAERNKPPAPVDGEGATGRTTQG